MHKRAAYNVGPDVQRLRRKYRVGMTEKARIALMALPGQKVSGEREAWLSILYKPYAPW